MYDHRVEKVKRLRAKNKLCAAKAHRYYGGWAQCLFPATRTHRGKLYCIKHYPPTVTLRRRETFVRRVLKLRKQLVALEKEQRAVQ